MDQGVLWSWDCFANWIFLAGRGRRPLWLLPSAVLAADHSKLSIAIRIFGLVEDLCSNAGILNGYANWNSKGKSLLRGGMF